MPETSPTTDIERAFRLVCATVRRRGRLHGWQTRNEREWASLRILAMGLMIEIETFAAVRDQAPLFCEFCGEHKCEPQCRASALAKEAVA